MDKIVPRSRTCAQGWTYFPGEKMGACMKENCFEELNLGPVLGAVSGWKKKGACMEETVS